MPKSFLQSEFTEATATYQAAFNDETLHTAILKASTLIEEALRAGHHIFWAGNGGSAADAQHLAAELLGRMNYDRPPLSSIALTTNTSTVTAIANDYGYENIFSRQLAGMAKKGDIFIGISTSGTSKNIIKAFEVCKAQGILNIGLCGSNTEAFSKLCDVVITAPSTRTPRIQEIHILAGHTICGLVERAIYPQQQQSAA